MSQKPISDLKEKALVETFSEFDLSDNDYFLLFCLLHLYELRTRAHIEVHGYTQRGASDLLATLWRSIHFGDKIPDKKKNPECHYMHWYWKWNTDWNGYDHFKRLDPTETARLEELKMKILEHGLIERIQIDSDDKTYNDSDES